MVLPQWKDLSPVERRSPRKMYEIIRAEINGDENKEPVFYRLNIHVKDENEVPIGSAIVTIIDSEDKKYTRTTGSAGGCTINEIPEGTYTVIAIADGYEDYECSEELRINQTKTLNITMISKE